MALVLDERQVFTDGELLLSNGPLKLGCYLTVEWLRGIPEPTWYGYFVPFNRGMRVLPGPYHITLHDQPVEVLVRKATTLGEDVCFPFWGIGDPPERALALSPVIGRSAHA